ncbi:hypothetical protein TorRG33x02_320720 [Trema orientale]|uniref:Uncharacterized protein n=1 Tax=Trema orientale TaxID=63057 RepID=A0A2P5BHP7_TREOI|nr:hypothetical protein TorRG33x02_320720 [Trema orientale]
MSYHRLPLISFLRPFVSQQPPSVLSSIIGGIFCTTMFAGKVDLGRHHRRYQEFVNPKSLMNSL